MAWRALVLAPLILLFSSLPVGAAHDRQASPPARPRSSPKASTGRWLSLSVPFAEFVYIPAAEFLMGSTRKEIQQAFVDCTQEPLGRDCKIGRFSSEYPPRKTRVSGFYLSRFEATYEDYQHCVRVRRCAPLPYQEGATRFRKQELPVVLVNHAEAQSYCAFRGARLPTEAEFERAARGTKRRTYPWGHLYNSRVSNHGALSLTLPDPMAGSTSDEDGYEELSPVGAFPAGATPEGVEDLAGNVREWVSDRFGPYARQQQRDPRGPTSSAETSQRVVRGGAFDSARTELRGASREWAPPKRRSVTIGFRCAKQALLQP